MSTLNSEVDWGLREGWQAAETNRWPVTDPQSVELWKHHQLRLRVMRQQDGQCFVMPYETYTYLNEFKTLRIGPYKSVEDAQLAAEMIGEVKGKEQED